ncbi:FMN-binding protein [Microbacterium sp. CH12i]|uniref:FMN-binding protein n=1 Tax=Microbacterium sp. CH12i TaxID=1479651 RepID=UPI0004619644|nr:FMN-binding protein [Microbacterium sp. CH12i]KDA05001.1 FMN-binding protein [Microbacterium sp. CH12i]
MKKILYTLLATVSGLVLLFSYRTSLDAVTPTDASATTATAGGSATTTDTGASGTGTTSGTGTSSNSTTSSTGLADGTYTGQPSQTRYGPVQVQITVSGGQVSDVQAVNYPNSNGRDRQINGTAIPRLVSETIQAQSSQIQMVSGATYTSGGYLSSLQSAIDQAQS